MESIIKADIFFVVTTVAVFVISVLFSIFLVYAIRTVIIIKYGVTKIKKTVDSSSEYIEEVKNDLKKQGALYSLLKKFFSKKK
jgi:hypothetical protein